MRATLRLYQQRFPDAEFQQMEFDEWMIANEEDEEVQAAIADVIFKPVNHGKKFGDLLKETMLSYDEMAVWLGVTANFFKNAPGNKPGRVKSLKGSRSSSKVRAA